ncbi:MAG: GH23 [uncultured Gemmatimonadetes bacterium]|uniref:GH23 n=1 Tax=uncultured Gemmatimonadota bacterium TaxID=203437 RepID=A0A6J4KM95_9BACT|nr:MAG: GH23 [uncultured Gemmatimonadota bacterium]
MQSLLLKLQNEIESRKKPRLDLGPVVRSAIVGSLLVITAFMLGARTASSSTGSSSVIRAMVEPAAGLGDLQSVEIARLKRITEYSSRYEIPADMAERIVDIARSEGIEPDLAFGLVRAESEFNHRAVSRVGAVGLTQLMPSTAKYFRVNGTNRHNLYDRDTNLRIGFRYLKTLLDKYDGNVRLALLAYNRGPERVDQLLRAGHNPNNGYVEMVMKKRSGRHN